MKTSHVKTASKKRPAPAAPTGCVDHMDGTFKGRLSYKFCDKGKIGPPA